MTIGVKTSIANKPINATPLATKLMATKLPVTKSTVIKSITVKPQVAKFIATLGLMGMLVGCQPSATTEDGTANSQTTDASLATSVSKDFDTSTNGKTGSQAIIPSAAAQHTIDQFEAEFVTKMLQLQQSQAAEFEALQEADSPLSQTEDVTQPVVHIDKSIELAQSKPASTVTPPATLPTQPKTPITDSNAPQNTADSADTATIQTDGSASLTLVNLPLVTIPIAPPEILTTLEISSRYKVAMQSLYLTKEVPLAAESVNTLLNIATLVPGVFADEQLAQRLALKMPALARLLKQYQTWEQIQAQQSLEMQTLQQQQVTAQEAQTKEFDKLVAEFDKTIKDYDKQIADYEKKLAEFK